MREILTIFAGLLILILTAALVGPYFVDWTAQRGWIETLLSQATGGDVEVDGAIDVKLLPIPSLRLEHVKLQGRAPGDASFEAEGIALQMAVTPLLRGEVQFIEADLRAPRVHLALGAEGSLALPSLPPTLPSPIQFSAIKLRNGAVTIDDSTGRPKLALAGLDIDAEAGSLVGPFKGTGRFEDGGSSVGFRFSSAALEQNQLAIKASIDATARTPAAEFAGTVGFAEREVRTTELSFDGTAAFAGTLALPGTTAQPWKISGPVAADVHGAKFSAFDLRIGDDVRALSGTGSAEIVFDGAPQARVRLSGRQLDIDKVLATKGRTAVGALAEALGSALADRHVADGLPFPLAVSFNGPTIVLGGGTLTDVTADIDLRPGAPIRLHAEVEGPGRSHLAVKGSIETGADAGFDGHVVVATRDKSNFADWLGMALPQAAERLRSLPFRTISLAGDARLSAVSLFSNNMRIEADSSVLQARLLSFTAASARQRADLRATLSADALDLDAVPDLSGVGAGAADLDFRLALDARAVRVARFGEGMIDAGRIHLEIERDAARTRLTDFSIADLGGASVSARAQTTPQSVQVDAKLDAVRLNELADLVRRVAPGPLAEAFAARATALSPAHVTVNAEVRSRDGALELAALRLSGTARGTRIDANTDPAVGLQSLTIGLDSADTPMLLRQIGFETLPLNGFGHGTISAHFSGPPGQALSAKLDAMLAGSDIAFSGQFDGSPVAPHGQGSISIKSSDLTPLLEILTVALPDATLRLPADASGNLTFGRARIALSGLAGSFGGIRAKGDLALDLAAAATKPHLSGALAVDRLPLAAFETLALGPPQPVKAGQLWSSTAFGASLGQVPAIDLSLSIGTFDLAPGAAASDAKLRLVLAPGVMTASDIDMKLGDGRLGGQLTVRRDAGMALAAGTARVEGLALRTPYLTARASGTLDFAATGQSEAALASSLAGSGTIRLAGLTIERSDPGALARIISATDRGVVAVDEPEERSALSRELDRAPLHLGDDNYDAALASGVLRLARSDAPGSSLGPLFTATLDGRRANAEARVDLIASSVPRDWNGAAPRASVVWNGPIGTATRTLDAGAFFDTLAARAVVRAAARLDLLEQDIRERAYFNRYFKGLRFMKRRQQEIAAFEAEQARQAEAARRAAEQARQADAARAETQPRAAPALSRLDHGGQGGESQPATDMPLFIGPPGLDPVLRQ